MRKGDSRKYFLMLEEFLTDSVEGYKHLWLELATRAPLDRVTFLSEMLISLALKHEEKESVVIWQALLHAISDYWLAPITRDYGQCGIDFQPRRASIGDSEASLAHNNDKSQRTASAQAIFRLLPVTKEVEEYQRHGPLKLVKHGTLFELKKCILEEVAGRWRDISKEITSEEYWSQEDRQRIFLDIFHWLLTVEASDKLPCNERVKEEKMFFDIIRQCSGALEPEYLKLCLAEVMRISRDEAESPEKDRVFRLKPDTAECWLKILLHALISHPEKSPFEIALSILKR